jgi:YegS/Rv2252/BmrU family lipid kinase
MNGQAETFVIINYNAARARAAWTHAGRVLSENGIRFDALEANAKGDARRAAREALRARYRTIAVVGGDGTLGEVVTGFFERAEQSDAALTVTPAPLNREAALAVLPGGTGNDFARGLEGGRASLDFWLERLIRHSRHDDELTTRAVDVLHGTIGNDARPFFCLNAATLGIGAEVAGRVAAQGQTVRWLSGETRFALAALAAIARWRSRHVSVQVDDGEAFECATNLIAVANSPFAGGGMMFSPDALLDDGLLDVVTASRLTRASLIREMTRIHRGGHITNPRVRISRGTRVRIEHLTPSDALAVEADGDVRGHTPVEFRVLAGALRVVI